MGGTAVCQPSKWLRTLRSWLLFDYFIPLGDWLLILVLIFPICKNPNIINFLHLKVPSSALLWSIIGTLGFLCGIWGTGEEDRQRKWKGMILTSGSYLRVRTGHGQRVHLDVGACASHAWGNRVTTIHGRQRAIFGTPKSQAGWLVFVSLIFLYVIKKMKHRFASEGKVAVPYHHLLTQWTRVVVTCQSWDHATAPQSPPVCAACSGLLAWGSYTAIQRDGFL